jgi:uncharacterized membrane protein YgcG
VEKINKRKKSSIVGTLLGVMNGESLIFILNGLWIMYLNYPEEKSRMKRYWLKDTRPAAEDASGEAGEGAGSGGGGFSGGGGDDFGGGGGDFGGEPGESPERRRQEHKHTRMHKHRRLLTTSSTRRWWRV